MAIKVKNQAKVSNSTQTESDGIYENIELAKIDPHPDNKNIYTMLGIDSLMRRIEESGFTGAIEVYLKSDGRYQISAGHRRYEAMKRLGKKSIPCIIKNIEDDTTIKKRLIESNINTRICSPLELSREILYYESALLEEGYPGSINDKLADVFNISKTKIWKLKKLNQCIDEIKEMALSLSFPYEAFEDAANFSKSQQEELAKLIKKHMETYSSSELSSLLVTQCINQIKKEIRLQKEREENNRIEEKAVSLIKESIKEADLNLNNDHKEKQQPYTEQMPILQSDDNDENNTSIMQENEYIDIEKTNVKPFEAIDEDEEIIFLDNTEDSELNYMELQNEEKVSKNIDLDLSIYIGRLNTIVAEDNISLSNDMRTDAIKALEKIIQKIKSL